MAPCVRRTRYLMAIHATLLISKIRLSRNISRFLLLRVNKVLLYLNFHKELGTVSYCETVTSLLILYCILTNMSLFCSNIYEFRHIDSQNGKIIDEGNLNGDTLKPNTNNSSVCFISLHQLFLLMPPWCHECPVFGGPCGGTLYKGRSASSSAEV